MGYRLKILPRGDEPRVARDVTDDEERMAEQCARRLRDLMSFVDFHSIMEGNFQDAYETIAPMCDSGTYSFAEANRVLVNVLSTFYMWVEHFEHSSKNWGVSEEFRSLKHDTFDRFPHYRLLYGLRTYAVHSGSLPISTAETNMLKGMSRLYIRPSILLESKTNMGAPIKKTLQELVSEGDRIDVLDFLHEAKAAYETAQRRFFALFLTASKGPLDYLESFVPGGVNPEMPDCWIIDDSGAIACNIGSALVGPIRKVEREYRFPPLHYCRNSAIEEPVQG